MPSYQGDSIWSVGSALIKNIYSRFQGTPDFLNDSTNLHQILAYKFEFGSHRKKLISSYRFGTIPKNFRFRTLFLYYAKFFVGSNERILVQYTLTYFKHHFEQTSLAVENA
jgi:hypothetical protein